MGVQREQQRLEQLQAEIAGEMNRPESEVSEDAKLIAKAIQEAGMRISLAVLETRGG